MAKQRREKFMDAVTIKSPRGVAIWCHINEADEYEGKATYKITLKLPKEGAPNQAEIDAYLEKIEDVRQAALKKAGKEANEVNMPVADGDERDWKGDGDNPYAGHWLLTWHSKYQPKKIVGIDGKPVDKDVWPFSGDIVRIGGELVPYHAKAKSIGTGVSLRLLGIQIIEKRARGFDEFEDESEGAETDPLDDNNDDASDI